MSEWRLFPEGAVPEFSTFGFFEQHPWISPFHQLGHAQRMKMTARMVVNLVASYSDIRSVTDLGCGDGSLLGLLKSAGIESAWGYDAGEGNLSRAAEFGLDVRKADLLSGFEHLKIGELAVASELVEHLVDPHAFVAQIPSKYLVLSSPSAETDEWHYEHHAWAWDMEGYRQLVEGAGWEVLRHVDCAAEINHHGGRTREQRFQAIAAVR